MSRGIRRWRLALTLDASGGRVVVMSVPVLRILGASYGLADCTQTIGDFVDSDQEVHINSPGQVLIDPSSGQRKGLSVTYQYGGEQPATVVVADNQPLSITYVEGPVVCPPTDPTQLVILGASYGLGVVTGRVQGLVQNDGLLITANDATFGSSARVVQTFTVVYRFGAGAPMVQTGVKGQPLRVWPVSDYALQLAAGAWAYGTDVVYQPGPGDLTIEAWVRTSTGGPVLSLTALGAPGQSYFYETLACGVFGTGAVGFRITFADPAVGASVGATTGPSPVCDGEWHHLLAAIRSGARYRARRNSSSPSASSSPNCWVTRLRGSSPRVELAAYLVVTGATAISASAATFSLISSLGDD